jgi:tetratricopeptide (TPR) repeat protein
MQRYRVNYRLLVGLAVGMVVSAGSAFALWRYQVDKNADALIERATKLQAENDYELAIQTMFKYVRHRPDELEGWKRLVDIAVAGSEREEAERDDYTNAYSVLVEAVQQTDNDEFRRKLVDMQVNFAPHVALDHLNQLLQTSPDDPDLQVLKLRCQFATRPNEAEELAYPLIGYDPKTGEFDPAKGSASDKYEVYGLLARYLISKDKNPELVDRLIDQMTQVNAETALAFVERSILLRQLNRKEEAREALARAAELAPGDADVLFQQGVQAFADYGDSLEPAEDAYEAQSTPELLAEAQRFLKLELERREETPILEPLKQALLAGESIEEPLGEIEVAKLTGALRGSLEPLISYYESMADGDEVLARRSLEKSLTQLKAMRELTGAIGIFSTAVKEHPRNLRFREQLARAQIAMGDLDAAGETLEQGIKMFGSERAINLTQLRVEVLISRRDFDAVAEELATLRKLNNPAVDALADFYDGRVLAINDDYRPAAKKMQSVRRRLYQTELQAMAARIEGFCQERMMQFDLARDAYNIALEINPKDPMALAGLQRVRSRMQVPGQGDAPDSNNRLDVSIREMLKRPPAQQDWRSIDDMIDEVVLEQSLPETRSLLFRAQVYVQRALAAESEQERDQLFLEARELVKRAYSIDENDQTVVEAAIRLLALQPGKGPGLAMQLLERAVANPRIGDNARLRVVRADLLLANGSDQLASQLAAVGEGMEDWDPKQQALVWSTLAARFKEVNLLAEAQQALMRANKLVPNSLPTAMFMFEIAMQMQDVPGMEMAQAEVLKIVGNKTDPNYVLLEVKRRLVGLSTGTVSKEEALQGRQMLDDAILVRPGWHELYILRGQFAALLDRDYEVALQNFEKAQELGRASVNAIQLHVRLLNDMGRYAEARDRLLTIPESQRAALLGTTGAEILEKTGDNEQALELAKRVAAQNADKGSMQVWLGDLAGRLGAVEVAEQAFRDAMEINRTDPEVWTRLITLYIRANQPDKLLETVREAHLALDAEFLPPLTAKYYELYGRWTSAEDIYLGLYKGQLDNPAVARKLAEFYLGWNARGDKDILAAAPYLNTLLRAAQDGTLSPDHPTAAWARQQAARIFAKTGDYQDSLKAEKLLSTGHGSDPLVSQDSLQLADVLSERRDPASMIRAVDLYNKIKEQQGQLTPEQGTRMGQLLFQVGDWDKCRRQMEYSISQYPNDLGIRSTYVSMLIQKRNFKEAERWIDRMERIENGAQAALNLRVRMAARQGNSELVRQVLRSMVPKLRAGDTEAVEKLLPLAILSESVEDYEWAATLASEYIKRSENNRLEAARLLALHGDLEEGAELIKKVFPSRIDDAYLVAVELLRARRDDNPALLDEMLNELGESALRDDPESAHRLRLHAEALEVQERFEEAIAAYDALLARDDVPKFIRATALNNLAYVLALTGNRDRLEDALRAADETVELLGPLSDVLDTRAVVLIAMGKPEKAVEDMELAVKVEATPSKYFHLIHAQVKAGQIEEAQRTWAIAQREGLVEDKISPLEREEFRRIAQQFGGLKTTSLGTTPTSKQ